MRCVDVLMIVIMCRSVDICWCIDMSWCVEYWCIDNADLLMWWCVDLLIIMCSWQCHCVDVLCVDVLMCWCVNVLRCVEVLKRWSVDVLMCWSVDVLRCWWWVDKCSCVDDGRLCWSCFKSCNTLLSKLQYLSHSARIFWYGPNTLSRGACVCTYSVIPISLCGKPLIRCEKSVFFPWKIIFCFYVKSHFLSMLWQITKITRFRTSESNTTFAFCFSIGTPSIICPLISMP